MPFKEAAPQRTLRSGIPGRIAVIGAGISGMGAAYRLADTNQVTLFEAGDRIGGHAPESAGISPSIPGSLCSTMPIIRILRPFLRNWTCRLSNQA